MVPISSSLGVLMVIVILVFAVLMQIENLVGDIRQATYTGMPSTIAKSPAQLAARMQNISSPNPNTYPRGTVAAQLQQQQAAYQRQQQQQKARIISKPMTPMAPLQKKKGIWKTGCSLWDDVTGARTLHFNLPP